MPPLSQVMELSIQQSITNAVIFTVVSAFVSIQLKYKNNILLLYKIIEKSLLLKKSPAITSTSNFEIFSKTSFSNKSLSKPIKE